MVIQNQDVVGLFPPETTDEEIPRIYARAVVAALYANGFRIAAIFPESDDNPNRYRCHKPEAHPPHNWNPFGNEVLVHCQGEDRRVPPPTRYGGGTQ